MKLGKAYLIHRPTLQEVLHWRILPNLSLQGARAYTAGGSTVEKPVEPEPVTNPVESLSEQPTETECVTAEELLNHTESDIERFPQNLDTQTPLSTVQSAARNAHAHRHPRSTRANGVTTDTVEFSAND
ncbi:PREDICTED: uncharacterized protein LOC105558299 [Vollenhovia emeryi]|uniref:uncharacterized protein LOC105558299 n=1 Tax=Vollenhovia emeryi TaxID=411798 RepID=UPI0005F5179F|nr:PREDICTED: uncharacterized protein LOC105558299 [Vollenhovia emeryi]